MKQGDIKAFAPLIKMDGECWNRTASCQLPLSPLRRDLNKDFHLKKSQNIFFTVGCNIILSACYKRGFGGALVPPGSLRPAWRSSESCCHMISFYCPS